MQKIQKYNVAVTKNQYEYFITLTIHLMTIIWNGYCR